MVSGLNDCGAPAMTPPISVKYGFALRLDTEAQSLVSVASGSVGTIGVYFVQSRLMSMCPSALKGNATSRLSVQIASVGLASDVHVHPPALNSNGRDGLTCA